MANSATLGTLRTRLEGMTARSFATSNFITTAQANQWLNDGLSRIHYLLADGDDFLKSTADTALVGGTALYSLPSDFYKVKGVDLVSGGSTYDLKRYMAKERNSLSESAPTGGTWAYMYRLEGQSIRLIPTPGAGTLRVHYVPQFAELLADGTLVNPSVPQGWEEYAVLYASICCAQREESDASLLMAKLNDLWASFSKQMAPRDQLEPLRVVDVHRRWDYSDRDIPGWRW